MIEQRSFIQGYKQGFTLLEVLVVIFILSISGAIVVPMLFYSIDNVTFKTSVKHLAAVMRYARSESINKKSIQRLQLDIKKGSYILKEQNKRSNNNNSRTGMDQESGLSSDFKNSFEGEESKKISGKSNSVYNVSHKLGKEIKFEMIKINDEEITEGSANIYFFPKGNSTGAKVFIANNKGKLFSVSVDSITGKVVIAKENKDYWS